MRDVQISISALTSIPPLAPRKDYAVSLNGVTVVFSPTVTLSLMSV